MPSVPKTSQQSGLEHCDDAVATNSRTRSSSSNRSFSPMKILSLLAVLLISSPATHAFAPAPTSRLTAPTTCYATKNDEVLDSTPSDKSRRDLLTTSLLSTASVLFAPTMAFAKGTTEAEDKAKIVSGYKRLTYLLDNWDKETTFCGTQKDPYSGKQICEKTPLVIQEYMGYKNINDPLFKAEKTLRRLEEFVPSNRETEFLDALEKWQMTADEAAGMAYTSSWAGPQNPNGGDDAIDYYLDRAKSQVVDARKVLAQVIDILDLPKS